MIEAFHHVWRLCEGGPGGLAGARDLFDYLRVGGVVHQETDGRTVVQFPGDRYITFRSVSSSGPPAIEINFPELSMKLHFLGD
ncbi:MAG TPA: hypothetical protein VFC38_07025 [Stellaceae bacterium]|nr:hypothetical protein [Stellaceae bacterium]